MNENKFPRYYDVKEIADILGVSTRHIYREVENGDIKAINLAIKLGKTRLKISEDEIERYIESHTYIGYNNLNRANDITQKRKYGRQANRS